MMGCKFTDPVSSYWSNGDKLAKWGETGRFISIHEDVLKDPVSVKFISTAYVIGERCPFRPHEVHATLRDDWEAER